MDKRINIYYKHVIFWMNFLKEKEIDAVLFCGIPHEVADYIIYCLCEKMGIFTCLTYDDNDIGVRQSKNKHMYLQYKIDDAYDEIFRNYCSLKEKSNGKMVPVSETAEKYIVELLDGYDKAEDHKLKLINTRRKEEIARYSSDIKQVWKDVVKKEKKISKLFSGARIYYRALIRTIRLVNYYEKKCEEFDVNVRYVYFALHYQPECTSSPMGGVFANQLLAIRLLSDCLPDDCLIYVKEHPHQSIFGRKMDYYNELVKIKKVRLISSRYTSPLLIKHSFAVATITGTVSWEAYVLGKPVLCFGTSPRTLMPGVYKVRTYEDCRNAMKDIIEGVAMPDNYEFEWRVFWNAFEKSCFDYHDDQETFEKWVYYLDNAINP